MGNVHESLLKSLNQRNFLFFYVQDSCKIPDRIESAAHKSRHAMTSHFRSPTRTFQFIVFCIVFARQDAIIFMSIPEVFGLCSTDSCCSTNRNVIQIDRWSAFCVGSTLVSILHTFYKKENGIGITSRHSMLHLIQQQASLSFRYVLLLLGGTRIPT
jgi:hypothetical protein